MTDWESLLASATSEAQKVCESVGSGEERGRRVGVGAAGDDTLVADREAERVIVKALLSAGDVRILSEEAGEIGPEASRYLAVVDPVDGSSNFSRGIPFYCASVCIVEGRRLSEAKCAIVRNLVNGDLFYAERGRGASKNGKKLRPSSKTELADSVAAVDLSKAEPEVISGLLPLSSEVGRQVHFGANALEICMVGAGELDAFVDLRGRMRVTDMAGAHLMVEEAGALITSEKGDQLDPPLDLNTRVNVVASANEVLHRKVLDKLPSFRERRL